MPSYTTTKNIEEFNKEIPRRSLSFIQETFNWTHYLPDCSRCEDGAGVRQTVASAELIPVSESAGSCVGGAWLNSDLVYQVLIRRPPSFSKSGSHSPHPAAPAIKQKA